MSESEWGISEIYRKHHEQVYQYCLFFTSDISLSQDLTQETFIKVVKSISNLKDTAKIKPWILKIARHTIMDHYRKKKLLTYFNDFSFNKQVTPEGTPEERLFQKEEHMELQRAISKLKLKYRNIVIYRGIWELSIKETAELLDCPETKVRVDYHRALKQLKEILTVDVEGGIATNEQRKRAQN
ncbi:MULTISPECIES: RNA polymerase sigma factor [Bacillus]|uniref:RNA polymerase sigma factor n=1 Tax=Bacillus TaxID=1386 RepID=UPI000BB81371|nr:MULTISPECIES: RNA polymerase sigma factor [Bacillus]